MEFLAQRRCVHRDLAARNVLVARGKIAKVADFGLAREVEQTDYYRRVTDGKLPVLWMSPESLFDGVSTTKSDVWSYGILLWEIVTCGERPYTGIASEALLDLIRVSWSLQLQSSMSILFLCPQDGYRMSIPMQCPQELYLLMKSCWHLQVRTDECMKTTSNSLLLSPPADLTGLSWSPASSLSTRGLCPASTSTSPCPASPPRPPAQTSPSCTAAPSTATSGEVRLT